MRLGLGTVQFGQAYGLAGSGSPVELREVGRILRSAGEGGVHYLDTAPAYGASESVLGIALWPDHPFRLVTKTPVFRRGVTAAEGGEVASALVRSLDRLQVDELYGLLVHDADDLLAQGGEHIFETLEDIKESGAVRKVGASVYDAGQIDRILDRFPVDLIQAPLSVLDQRLLASGHLGKMKERGIEIHARSVFLQGLLLIDPERLPAFFDPIRTHLRGYRRHLEERAISPVDAALGFVRDVADVDAAICGVESVAQLGELRQGLEANGALAGAARFALDDARFVDPRNWESGA